MSRFPEPGLWAGRRVLVTGNTGFKGSWLSYWLGQLGAEVLGLSLAEPPSEPSLWEELGLQVDTIRDDVRDASWVDRVRGFGPEVVFHLAAQPLVAEGYRSPRLTFDTNVSGVAQLLDSIRDLPALRALVVITTDKVYDPRQAGPHSEDAFLGGRDPYSASKAAAELVCASWPDANLPLVTARAGNVVGGGDWAADRLVPDLVRAWSAGNELILRDPSGVRPWQHVLEPLRGYLLYAEALMLGRPVSRALNFGPSAADMVAVGELVAFSAGVWAGANGSGTPAASPMTARPYAETASLTLASDRAAPARLGEPADLAGDDRDDPGLVSRPPRGHLCDPAGRRRPGFLPLEGRTGGDRMTVPASTRLGPRGTETCRGCGARSLSSVLDLGSQPLANELPATLDYPQGRFPLHLRICMSCGLGQVGEYVLPERIFGDYPYLSSMSESWLAHARVYAKTQSVRLGLGSDSWVLEVASNDGYLLREFISLGVGVLGVEPARNVAQIARLGGVETVSEFFGVTVAERIGDERGAPRLIVANNVMAHVPNMDDFVGGLAALADDRTLISVENPTIMNMLRLGQFDTIYHEHFSYLSAHAVSRIAARHGLALVDIEELPTHGGSYRYWLGRQSAHPVAPAVGAAIARELEHGLLEEAVHKEFARRCGSTISGLQAWLDTRRSSGSKVVAYGAAAKGNTLLNAAGVDNSVIVAAVDASPEKQGRFLPGSGIPILAPADLPRLAATDILLLPWNLRDEVSQFVARVSPASTLWIAVPEMEVVPR